MAAHSTLLLLVTKIVLGHARLPHYPLFLKNISCRTLLHTCNDFSWEDLNLFFLQVLFRRMHGLRQWAQLQQCDDKKRILQICRALEAAAMNSLPPLDGQAILESSYELELGHCGNLLGLIFRHR